MPTGLSLHIGLNSIDPGHYGGWSGKLNACEADAEDTAALARAAGFETSTLLTKDGTRKAVLGWLEEAAGRLQAGDIFLVLYSGHGGQVPDPSGEEPDSMDETWCLYDGQVVDDELYAAYGRFQAGVRGLVLSDSCHSGSVVKRAFYKAQHEQLPLDAAGAAYKYVPPEVSLRSYRSNRDFYDSLRIDLGPKGESDPQASVRLISGCQDNQYSQDGTFNSAFTAALLQVWADGRFKGDYAEFHRQIQEQLPPTQSPNHLVVGAHDPAYDAQKPFTI